MSQYIWIKTYPVSKHEILISLLLFNFFFIKYLFVIKPYYILVQSGFLIYMKVRGIKKTIKTLIELE